MNHFAVVLGLSPTGLYVARELGSAGVPVLGVCTARQAGMYSRHLTHAQKVLHDRSPAALLEQLLELGERSESTGVLIPTSDEFIELIVQNHELLGQYFRFQKSYNPETCRQILDKGELYRLCKEHSVGFPAGQVAKREDLEEVGRQVRYPCILKPTLIHRVKSVMRGRKVLIADSAESYQQLVHQIPDGDTDWLIQEIVTGPESNISLYGAYFDGRSDAHQSCTCTKLRQYPPGFGSASLVRSAPHPEIKQLADRLLRAVGYTGIAAAEFKWDERDSAHKLIEINPRPALWFGVTHDANKRIALAAYYDQLGLPLPEETPQRDGVQWRYVVKDLYAKLFYLTKGRSFVLPAPQLATAGSGVSLRTNPVGTWNDWRPVWGELQNYMMKLFSRR